VLRSDGGMEFQGEVATWADKLGVTRQPACAMQSTENGRVERWHRTMAESIRAMLDSQWPDGVLVGRGPEVHCWVKSRTAHKALGGLTPHEVWTGRQS